MVIRCFKFVTDSLHGAQTVPKNYTVNITELCIKDVIDAR